MEDETPHFSLVAPLSFKIIHVCEQLHYPWYFPLLIMSKYVLFSKTEYTSIIDPDMTVYLFIFFIKKIEELEYDEIGSGDAYSFVDELVKAGVVEITERNSIAEFINCHESLLMRVFDFNLTIKNPVNAIGGMIKNVAYCGLGIPSVNEYKPLLYALFLFDLEQYPEGLIVLSVYYYLFQRRSGFEIFLRFIENHCNENGWNIDELLIKIKLLLQLIKKGLSFFQKQEQILKKYYEEKKQPIKVFLTGSNDHINSSFLQSISSSQLDCFEFDVWHCLTNAHDIQFWKIKPNFNYIDLPFYFKYNVNAVILLTDTNDANSIIRQLHFCGEFKTCSEYFIINLNKCNSDHLTHTNFHENVEQFIHSLYPQSIHFNQQSIHGVCSNQVHIRFIEATVNNMNEMNKIVEQLSDAFK
ncbi:Uncharacterized protein QTN25_003515 [Entamoeba marina]